jgi:tetratricopeptide (TPR) repeat protein
LLLVLEDAHWLDDLSRELARAVAAGIADCPVFFLTIYRPPEVEGSAALWVSPPLHFAEIRLSPFSPEETRQLICLKLGERLLPPDLLDKIEALSQGNPFFVDEFINLLQERAVRLDDPAVLASLDVPDSVQTLIVSRLDQLAESEKMALRVASVIGQLFRTRWLLAIYPGELRDELLFRNLEHIRSLGMLYLDKPSPELEYLFKHAIMQEVVYGTLSFANRRMLHQRVTGYIENTYADDLGPWYGILAYHCQHSEQVDKEYTYVCLAGKQAARQSAHRQAAEFFGRAVNLFKVQGQSSPQDEFDLRLELCEQHSILGNHALLVENVTALMSLSQGLDPARRVEALLKRGGIERGDGSVEDARRYFQEAIDLTRQNRNALGLSKALFHMGGTYFDSSEYAKAKEILYKLVEEATPETWLQKARAQQILGWVCYDEGRFDETEQHWQSAHTAFVEHGHKPLQALVLTNLGALYATRGYIVKAIEFGRRGLTLAVQLGYRGGEQEAWRLLGDHYFLTGQFEQGWECFSHCVEISHQLGERTYGLAYSWARMAEILVEQAGDLDQALALAQQAYDLAHDPADLELGGWIRQARGRARLARGDTAGARADLEESLRMRKELGQADTVPLMLAYLGLLDLQVGDLDSARGRVNEMWAILFPIGRDGTECPEACWACYRILDVTGDSDRARQALQRGFAILQKMAGNMETEEIRRSYLEQITINRAVVEAYLAFSPSCCPHG